MTMGEVEQVFDTADKIKKISATKVGTTVTLRSTKMPGKPQVVVDEDTGRRVITVIKNE